GMIVINDPGGTITSTAIDHHSGTLSVDGTAIHYTGMAPVVDVAGSVDVNAGDGDLTLTSDATFIYRSSPSMETHDITMAGLTALSFEAKTVTINGDLLIAGASLTITASDAITVGSGVVVSTSDPAGTGGAITFKGTTITLDDGAQLLADGPSADTTRAS